ncbi:acyl carrier protein, partial [Streptomyces boncukensis]
PAPDRGRAAADDSFRRRFDEAGEAERPRLVLDLVREAVAAALGHRSPDEIESRRGFVAMGFDSLTAVETRNRISAKTGLRLPSTLMFDHPTPADLADHLAGQLTARDETPETDVLAELRKFEAMVAALPPEEAERIGIRKRLGSLLESFQHPVADTSLESAGLDDMFAIIDEELEEP